MASNPLSDPNWAKHTADTVERLVTTVRDKTTANLAVAARGLVFGLLGAILGLVALVLFLIAISRALQAVLEYPLDHDTAVWVSYLLLGTLFCLIGAILMAKRHTTES